MDRKIIEQYEHGGDKLRQVVQGLTHDDLHALPVPGTWSIQQIIIHLLDSDLVLADRMKRVIAEDKPALLAFDENRWAKQLAYDFRSADDAVALFGLNRKQMAEVMRRLPDEAFARTGTHNERGVQTLEQIVGFAVEHLDHHLKFARDKREKLGKLMW
jgi:uncharacterized damage-inducible protein DinB